jgi:hypothetical protein
VFFEIKERFAFYSVFRGFLSLDWLNESFFDEIWGDDGFTFGIIYGLYRE